MSTAFTPADHELAAQAPPIQIKQLHPTFAAEASGVDFRNVTPAVVAAIKLELAKYGVLVFRQTGLTDKEHVEMSRLFGPLDDVTPYITGLGQINRLPYDELFDVSNINPDGSLTQPGSKRDILAKCNINFHVDSAFNPRRAGYSLLLAHELPPPGTGGDTEFADSRQAYADLDDATKLEIRDWIVNNSQFQCRRKASNNHPMLMVPEYDPKNNRFGQHRLVQLHEPSGRMNMYIAAHAYSVVGMDEEESQKRLSELLAWAAQDKYKLALSWHNPGDLMIWDNTAVMHRATGGVFEGKYRRDCRRSTVHDMSTQAWGLNEVGATWRSGLP